MLALNTFFVKEQVGLMKMSNTYDILNPDTQEKVGVAQEKPNLLLRLLLKKAAPTAVEVRDAKDQLVFTIKKPFKLFGRPRIAVFDKAETHLGYFVSKMFSIGGGFHVYGPDDNHIAEVKGNWKSKDFQLLTPPPEQKELGKVSKKWAGLAKEFFTTADNYVVGINDAVAKDEKTKMLLLAAALTIDMVYKE